MAFILFKKVINHAIIFKCFGLNRISCALYFLSIKQIKDKVFRLKIKIIATKIYINNPSPILHAATVVIFLDERDFISIAFIKYIYLPQYHKAIDIQGTDFHDIVEVSLRKIRGNKYKFIQ